MLPQRRTLCLSFAVVPLAAPSAPHAVARTFLRRAVRAFQWTLQPGIRVSPLLRLIRQPLAEIHCQRFRTACRDSPRQPPRWFRRASPPGSAGSRKSLPAAPLGTDSIARGTRLTELVRSLIPATRIARLRVRRDGHGIHASSRIAVTSCDCLAALRRPRC